MFLARGRHSLRIRWQHCFNDTLLVCRCPYAVPYMSWEEVIFDHLPRAQQRCQGHSECNLYSNISHMIPSSADNTCWINLCESEIFFFCLWDFNGIYSSYYSYLFSDNMFTTLIKFVQNCFWNQCQEIWISNFDLNFYQKSKQNNPQCIKISLLLPAPG